MYESLQEILCKPEEEVVFSDELYHSILNLDSKEC
jgi:hypothetical protein